MDSRTPGLDPVTPSRGALLIGGVAAILASTCCLVPLLLLALGISGAWIGNLTALSPYQPVFIGLAVLALVFAWRGIGPSRTACDTGKVCARPQASRAYRMIFGIAVVLVLVALVFPTIAPWFY